MDEQECDSLFRRSFASQDAMRADAQGRRCITLAAALWGRTFEDLQHQLNAPFPAIPSGFSLDDFLDLLRRVQMVVGKPPSSMWEARCEVVRRAIQRLQNS